MIPYSRAISIYPANLKKLYIIYKKNMALFDFSFYFFQNNQITQETNAWSGTSYDGYTKGTHYTPICTIHQSVPFMKLDSN